MDDFPSLRFRKGNALISVRQNLKETHFWLYPLMMRYFQPWIQVIGTVLGSSPITDATGSRVQSDQQIVSVGIMGTRIFGPLFIAIPIRCNKYVHFTVNSERSSCKHLLQIMVCVLLLDSWGVAERIQSHQVNAPSQWGYLSEQFPEKSIVSVTSTQMTTTLIRYRHTRF